VSPFIAARLGYDPDRVAELPALQQRALALAALAAAPAVGLLGASAAYGAFLSSDTWAVGIPVGVGAGLYLFNLLRVAVAGGGVGPQQPYGRITTFFPRTVPLVMLALLGVFFAQPLLLGLLAREQDAEIDALRASLLRTHQQAMVKEQSTPSARLEAEQIEPYRRHLAHSHFLLRRVQLTWERPQRAALFSFAMVLLMVLPWLASATIARRAARAYEAGRWKTNRAIIDAAWAQARRLEEQALRQWATYEGPRLELCEDAPYNTRPRAGAGRYEVRHG
jgi:hypothetical protein